MGPMYISKLAHAIQGEIVNCFEDLLIKGISTDSREIKSGDLFVPIIGENFDGHNFIESAIDAGAVAVLSDRYLHSDNIPYIKIKDTQDALINIAGYYRSKFNIPAIAITGSSGKTTTKEMVAAVLSQSYNVLKNEGNYNNTIGLPHTIFRLDKSHEICVLEMGMNSFGEIKRLASIVKPDVAVITNIGTAHIEFLESRENILKAKMEIIEHFTSSNTLIINGDDDMLKTIKNKDFVIISIGLNKENNIYAFDIKQVENKGMEFCVKIGEKAESFYIPLIGMHNVYNGLCAIAVGIYMGMSFEKIKHGLSNFVSPSMRMESFISDNCITVINDAYNANPQSMEAAMETLINIQNKARKVLILGDMMELGKHSEIEHYKVGKLAASKKIDVLITIGERSKKIQKGALENGMLKVFHFEDNQKAIDYLMNILLPFDTVLIKGSRAAKMEEIAYFLQERR